MTYKRLQYDINYRNIRRQNGYVRLDMWIPIQYKKKLKSLIKVLSCHFESPASTTDFHEDINNLFLSIADRYDNEYEVKNEPE